VKKEIKKGASFYLTVSSLKDSLVSHFLSSLISQLHVASSFVTLSHFVVFCTPSEE
jgi:hypothetical protein